MRTRITAQLAWVLWAGTVVLSTGQSLLLVPVYTALPDVMPFALRFVEDACYILTSLAFATLGALIVTRRPEHRLGWLFCAIGLAGAADSFAGYYALNALLVAPGTLPGGLVAAWFQNWDWMIGVSLLLFFLPLLFPTGRLLSARWRFVSWFAVCVILLQCPLVALRPGPLGNYFVGLQAVANPLGVAAFDGLLPTVLGVVLSQVGPLLILPATSSLLLRLRRARGKERQQIKWVVYVGAIAAALWLARALVVYAFHLALPALEILLRLGVSGSLLALPIAAGIAIFTYRLYDIDLLINRTLVYGMLTACVVALYALTVGSLGVLFQAQGSGLIALLVTGLVAVLFQPLRERLQRGVNRLLYGERDEPYAVFSLLGRRLEATLTPGTILPAIVETVTQALKLPYAAISLKHDEAFTLAASSGTESSELVSLPLVYQHETVGQLLLSPRAPGEPLTPSDLRLLSALARQAGLAVQAVRLTVDLQRARERLVTAREEERRRLRRDLHDGLGPQLASLTLKLETARNKLAHDPLADSLLTDLTSRTQTAVADIRRLVYALRPPALDELGLVPALREQAFQYSQPGPSPLLITCEAPQPLPPLPAAVEVAVYRIAQEALTNVVRHARADQCHLHLVLDSAAGMLSLEIQDNGCGLSPTHHPGVGLASMRERAEELGGTWTIGAASTGGTRIFVQFPSLSPETGDSTDRRQLPLTEEED
jgi:signal transduction histidine kinase